MPPQHVEHASHRVCERRLVNIIIGGYRGDAVTFQNGDSILDGDVFSHEIKDKLLAGAVRDRKREQDILVTPMQMVGTRAAGACVA